MFLTMAARTATIAEWGRTSWSRLDAFLVKHQIAIFWILGILYKFALDAMYIWAASPQGLNEGLLYQPGFIRYTIAIIMYLVLFAILPKQEKDTVTFLLHLQFVYTVAPTLCYYSFAAGSHKYMLAVFLCILIQTLVVNCRSQRKHVPICIVGIQNYVTVSLALLAIICLIIPVLYNGFAGLKAFNFSYVYVMRANQEFPPFFPRLLTWVTSVIVPFFLLYALHKKKWWTAVLLVVFQTISYMETGYKADLLMLVPVLFIYLLSKSGHLVKLIYVGFTLLCLLVLIAYRLDRGKGVVNFGVALNALVCIRALFFPARLKFAYYECFKKLPKLFFSEGMIGKVFSLTYPFQKNVGHVVTASMGYEFGSSSSNTGYLGDSYAQMGFLGMILMSLLFAYVLRGLRTYDSDKVFPVLAGLFAVYVITLNDGALFTVLLTSGMALAFLLVFIYFGRELKEANNGI